MKSDLPVETKGLPQKSRARTIWRVLIVLFLLVAGMLSYAAFDAYRFLATAPEPEHPREIIISIPQGATFDRVAWNLKKQGVIADVTRFRLLGQYKKAIGAVKAGDFLLSTGWTPDKVLWQITSGQAVLHKLVLREGLTWWEAARAIEAQGFASYEDFKAVIHDTAFLQEMHIPFSNAEGFLYPETYLLKKPERLDSEQARFIASLLVNTFWKKTRPLWEQLPKKTPEAAPAEPHASVNATMKTPGAGNAIGKPEFVAAQDGEVVSPRVEHPLLAADPEKKSPERAFAPPHPSQVDPDALHHLVIVASLVEKETGVPEERARVAGVYSNRLRLGWLLQCDPTIIYGVGERFSGPILRSQINDAANTYNTYQHAGLPPGPIASAGYASLEAALFPERHDYFFFVATGEGKGHTFSTTLDAHNKAVRVYRQAVNGR